VDEDRAHPDSVPVPHDLGSLVRRALDEDLGGGDVTAELVPAGLAGAATVVARESAVLCGAPWFDAVYAELDGRVHIEWCAAEGSETAADAAVCRIEGPARALLSGERTALNFLQTLSGTATLARCYAEAVRGTGARVLDTRKTVPGLRGAQKYAVRVGGGHNHRMGLFDAVLIKENHILAAGSLEAALEAARARHLGLPVEVEVETLAELDRALAAGAERVLLDDFTLDAVREAVRRSRGRARLEVSGGVRLETIRAFAETGVDDISVGALTKDVRAADFSMRFDGLRAGGD